MPSGTATIVASTKPPNTRHTVMPMSWMKLYSVKSSQPSLHHRDRARQEGRRHEAAEREEGPDRHEQHEEADARAASARAR